MEYQTSDHAHLHCGWSLDCLEVRALLAPSPRCKIESPRALPLSRLHHGTTSLSTGSQVDRSDIAPPPLRDHLCNVGVECLSCSPKRSPRDHPRVSSRVASLDALVGRPTVKRMMRWQTCPYLALSSNRAAIEVAGGNIEEIICRPME